MPELPSSPSPNSTTPSSDRTFYNDSSTGLNHPQPTSTSPTTSPTTPFPNISPTNTSTNISSFPYNTSDSATRLHTLERRLSGLERVLSSQSAKLTTALDQLSHISSQSAITLPESKPVEKRKEDYVEKFSAAKDNAKAAVKERKRTLSNKIMEGMGLGVGVGEDAEKKKFVRGMARSVGKVVLNVDINVKIDSELVLAERMELSATEFLDLESLLHRILSRLQCSWTNMQTSEKVESVTMQINTETTYLNAKWSLQLEEDTHAADANLSPTKITKEQFEAARATYSQTYTDWWERNVKFGKKEGLGLVFGVDLKSGLYCAPEA